MPLERLLRQANTAGAHAHRRPLVRIASISPHAPHPPLSPTRHPYRGTSDSVPPGHPRRSHSSAHSKRPALSLTSPAAATLDRQMPRGDGPGAEQRACRQHWRMVTAPPSGPFSVRPREAGTRTFGRRPCIPRRELNLKPLPIRSYGVGDLVSGAIKSRPTRCPGLASTTANSASRLHLDGKRDTLDNHARRESDSSKLFGDTVMNFNDHVFETGEKAGRGRSDARNLTFGLVLDGRGMTLAPLR